MRTDTETRAIVDIESTHMRLRNVVIVLEDMDFRWTKVQMNEAVDMYQEGWSLKYMSEYFQRDPDEVALLVMHLARSGRIRKRGSGWSGNGVE